MENYLTIKQFTDKHKAFPPSALRFLIFKRNDNGLLASGAIIKLGHKILIDEPKFFEWVKLSNKWKKNG
jgi:hypothetical protein